MASRSIWLAPVLALQVLLAFRLSNSLSESEALAINSGHQLIGQLLHGTATPDFGRYFNGVPSLYAVPAALLDSAAAPRRACREHPDGTRRDRLRLSHHQAAVRPGRRTSRSAVFALAPQTLFDARFASTDAPALLMLAAAMYLAASPRHRQRTQVLAGVLLGLAACDRYFTLLYVPGVLAVAYICARSFGTARGFARAATIACAGLVTAATIALLSGPADWPGWQATVLGGHAVDLVDRASLLHQAIAAVGVLVLVGMLAVVVSAPDRVATTLLWVAAVAPVVLEVGFGESASIQRNAVFSVLFLAPVVGVAGRWLVGRGPFLALRAPASLAATVFLLSAGMSTSSAMMHSWPSSTSINGCPAHLRRGRPRHLPRRRQRGAGVLPVGLDWLRPMGQHPRRPVRGARRGRAAAARPPERALQTRPLSDRCRNARPGRVDAGDPADPLYLGGAGAHVTQRLPLQLEPLARGATSMTHRRTAVRAAAVCGVLAVVFPLAACAPRGEQHLASSAADQSVTIKAVKINKAKLLRPAQKYFGVFMQNVPQNITPIDNLAAKTGKQPNLDMYFQAWNGNAARGKSNFNTKIAQNACAAGMLPMFTWESWNTAIMAKNPPNGITGVAYTQAAFAPAKIASGAYDAYITATAKRIAALGCPLALRFDQEQNGYWYPWGIRNTDMPGTDASRSRDFIAMWRHVWRLFQAAGATNVLWLWSPNIESGNLLPPPALSASYPGSKYVDWVGLDGYYFNKPRQTFGKIFDATMRDLRPYATKKPWIVAETGRRRFEPHRATEGPADHQPARLDCLPAGVQRVRLLQRGRGEQRPGRLAGRRVHGVVERLQGRHLVSHLRDRQARLPVIAAARSTVCRSGPVSR